MTVVLNEAVALVTLDELMIFLGKSLEDVSEDDKLTTIINAVGEQFNKYTNRVLVKQEIEEELWGEGKRSLWVKAVPVDMEQELVVSVMNEYDEVEEELVLGDDYIMFWEFGRLMIMSDDVWEKNRKIKVKYTGGFETIPDDLKMAALIACQLYLEKQDTKSWGEMSRGIAGQSVQFTEGIIVREVKDILDKYKLRRG